MIAQFYLLLGEILKISSDRSYQTLFPVMCFVQCCAILWFLYCWCLCKVSCVVLDWLVFLTGQRIVKRLRATMFSSIVKQETAFFDKTRTGELINRLSSDTALLGRSVTENLSDGLRAGAQASVGVGMMVWWSLTCLTLLVVSHLFQFC